MPYFQYLNNHHKPIVIWLFSGCFLVFAMVVVGGITRLTGSGLSITEWNVIMGAVPPLTQHDWQIAFEKYQSSPQFLRQNFNFELHDFKNIFWWEFIHRLLGRLIGIVFLVPFLWFLLKKQLEKRLIFRLLFIFALGGLQGFFGWYMVKSGLVDNPRVSHYRLATHLIAAFATFGFIFTTALDLLFPEKYNGGKLSIKINQLVKCFFALVVFQILYGAFVAGLKAGNIYNTFPLMGDEWIASSVRIAYKNDGLISFFENLASIQFIHRWLAVLLVIFFGGIIYLAKQKKEKKYLNSQQLFALNMTAVVLAYQFILGVFTLIYKVPIVLGVLHQMGAFFLFTAVLYLLHRFRIPDTIPSD